MPDALPPDRYQNVAELVADLAVLCPLQGSASSARISGILHVVAQREAGRGPREDSQSAAQGAGKAWVTLDRPTKNDRPLSGETPTSWQAPSTVARLGAKLAKPRYLAIAVVCTLAVLLIRAGAQVRMAAPADTVAPAPPSHLIETVRAPDDAQVPPAPAAVPALASAEEPVTPPAASSRPHPKAPRAAPQLSGRPPVPGVATAASVSPEGTPERPVRAPVNPLDIPIK